MFGCSCISHTHAYTAHRNECRAASVAVYGLLKVPMVGHLPHCAQRNMWHEYTYVLTMGYLFVYIRFQHTRWSFRWEFSPDLAPNNNSLQNSYKIGNALLHWQSVSTELYFYTFYTAHSAAWILSCTWAHWWTTGLTDNTVMNISKERKRSAKTGPDKCGLLKNYMLKTALLLCSCNTTALEH